MRSKLTMPHSFIIRLAAIGMMAVIAFSFIWRGVSNSAETPQTQDKAAQNTTPTSEVAIDLTDSQLSAIKIDTIENYNFHQEKEEIGSVAYHEKSLETQAHNDNTATSVIANVMESDSPLIRIGQPVHIKLLAYPDRIFEGKVAAIGVTVYDAGGNPALDPNTHRISVRCDVTDSKNEFYPGMLATIMFEIHKPVSSPALPENGIVREGDGAMTAWTTIDRHHFTQRFVKIGINENGKVQILEGINQGEMAVTDGAIFLDNMLQAPTAD